MEFMGVDMSRDVVTSNLYHFLFHILNGLDIVIIGRNNQRRADERLKLIAKHSENLNPDALGYYLHTKRKIQWDNYYDDSDEEYLDNDDEEEYWNSYYENMGLL